MIEITSAVILTSDFDIEFDQKVRDVFRKRLYMRSGIRIPDAKTPDKVTLRFLTEKNPSAEEILELFSGIRRPGKEGFRIRVIQSGEKTEVIVLGRDARGEFYGMARLLRKAEIIGGRVFLDEKLDGISLTPCYPLRGHQLGYRDKNNTYSAWTVHDFGKYIEDMALFGANAIELLPPRTDDRLYSSTFVENPMHLMTEVSRIIHSYGMDTWLWYPNVGTNYGDPKCMHEELDEREKVFSKIPYLDGILIPLGDPGSLWPTDALKVSEEFVRIMHKYHPQAKVWVAPQHFQPEPGWYDAFYNAIAKEPDWIDGVCFAPWEQDTITEMRNKLPAKYKDTIRNYPDISHNSNCQFPVPEWDDAFALTLGREGNNARPRAMKHIHNMIEPYTIGSITYSEGIHDDINKTIWCDQDFDSAMPVSETLEDYVRLFIDSTIAKPLSEIILEAENDWKGPILENDGIDTVYDSMCSLDRNVSESIRDNFRYQMIKLRVFSDYWTKQKYREDRRLEKKAREVIGNAAVIGADQAIREARSFLNESYDHPAAESLLFEMQKLADSLYEKCRIQLTVSHHGGQKWIRGAYLETARMPLNDYQYLMQSFKAIEKLPSEVEKTQALERLNEREKPAEGDFYFNLGTYDGFRHVTKWHSWEEDPGFLRTPVMDHSIYSIMGLFHEMRGWYTEFPMPLSMATNATVLYGTPLEVTFDGLDPEAYYELRVFYPNSFLKAVHMMQVPKEETQVHFWAGDILIADSVPKIKFSPDAYWKYDLPGESYKNGTLKLRWQTYGILKAFAVGDIWIIRKNG